LLLAAAAVVALPLQAGAATLGVCLDDGSPPYSFKRRSSEGGFDLVLAKELAARLGRELKVQWFESEFERESSLAVDANALLSAGKCDLVAAYPLVASALGLPGVATAPPPRHEGGQGGRRAPRVPLGPLIASRPYHAAALEIVVGAQDVGRKIAGLGDLAGLKLGVTAGTLSGTILMAWGGGKYVPDIVSLAVGGDLLKAMEEGQFQATLIERHKLDAYRARHPATKLTPTGYVHPIGFNLGYAALERNRALVEEVDQAITAMRADGTLGRVAEAAGITLFPPRVPEVFDRLTPGMLRGE
jgi:ABC-type amino acid transport substrate-binding protein